MSSITDGDFAQDDPSPPHTPHASTDCTVNCVALAAAVDACTNMRAM